MNFRKHFASTLEKQREENRKRREANAARRKANAGKGKYQLNYEFSKEEKHDIARKMYLAEQAAFRLKVNMLWTKIKNSPGAMEEIFKFCMADEPTTEEVFGDSEEERFDI